MVIERETLTGRTRHRPGFERTGGLFRRRGRRVLVLQVEFTGIHSYHNGHSVDSEWITSWRDARVEDLPAAGDIEVQAAA